MDADAEAKWDAAATREPEENAWGITDDGGGGAGVDAGGGMREVAADDDAEVEVGPESEPELNPDARHAHHAHMTVESAVELAGELHPGQTGLDLEPKDWTGDSSDDGSDDSGICGPVAVR